jgi:hypothetical protein
LSCEFQIAVKKTQEKSESAELINCLPGPQK